MADNILTKDRNAADIALAAKDVGGILFPRNIMVDPSGADITPLTDEALRAAPVPVSGAFYQATQPVSVAALPLPSGAAATPPTCDSTSPRMIFWAPSTSPDSIRTLI